jgi:K+-sensing histidine kinase KdpD
MQSHGEPLAQNAELELALSQGLDIPLRALRASMESMSKELAREGDSASLLAGALEEVEQLGRNVRELVEFASAPRPMPLVCTVDEVLLGARDGLTRSKRRKVTIAHAKEGSMICVDGPLLARILQRFLENALEAGSEHVLLIAHCEAETTRFTVFDDAPNDFDAEWAVPAFRSTKRNHLGLGLSLAKRDVALLDGSLEFSNCPRGNKYVAVIVPDQARIAIERAA